MKVPLNTLFKIPMKCVLRNKMSNAWNSDGNKECLGKGYYYGFSICRDMCDLNLYSEYLGSKRVPEFFTPKGTTLRQWPKRQ